MEIVAILDKSAGNQTVGEMWKETKVFKIDASIKDVIRWAYVRHNNTEEQYLDGNTIYDIKNFRGNLTLSVSQ